MRLRLTSMAVITAALCSPAAALPGDPCWNYAKMAAEIMLARQQEAPIADVMQATTLSEGQDPEAATALADLILQAYKRPIGANLKEKGDAIKLFSEEQERLCRKVEAM